ncbi:MAG: tetratricopeptide repeat protein [Thermoplasmata archaeon]|nr:MAG: tetratricopeptide repeat protein [Thermoplasmata archaeon]
MRGKSLLSPEDRLVLHLSKYRVKRKNYDLPMAITREGMAKAIGVDLNHISWYTNKLKEKGYIQDFKGRTKGKSRKQNFYILTIEGGKYAKSVIKRLNSSEITVIETNEDPRKMAFDDVLSFLREKDIQDVTELDICRIASEDGVLRIQALRKDKEKEFIDFSEGIPEIVHFFGRKMELSKLEKWILDKKKNNIIFINGMAGIGKTTLVAKLLENHRGSVHIFWHNFQELDTLRGILTKMAAFLSRLGHDHLEMHLRTRTTLDYFEVSGILGESIGVIDAILIFDDFQKSNDQIRKFFVYFLRMLAPASKTKMLILSREMVPFYDRRDVISSEIVAELELEGLDFESSKKLLKGKGINKSMFKEIYGLTAGNPLFLEVFESKVHLERFMHNELFLKLGEDERKILGVISIYRFPVSEDILAVNDDFDFEKLYSLTQKSIVKKDASDQYFVHDIIKQFFYSRLTPSKKREFHLLAAGWYENTDEPTKFIEAIYHYQEAGDNNKASQLAILSSPSILDGGYPTELLVILERFDEKNIESSEWAELLIVKGKASYMVGEWRRALLYYNKSSEIASMIGDKKLKVKAICASGHLLEEQNELDKAMKCFKKCLDISKNIEYSQGIGESYRGIGRTYWRNSEHKKAIRNFKNCLEISERLSHYELTASTYIDMGNVYDERYEIENAITCYNKSLDILKNVNNKYETARTYGNLGITHKHLGEFDKAIECTMQELILAQELNEIRLIGYSNAGLGYYHAKIGDFKKAKKYTKKAEEIASKIDNENIMYLVYKTYALIFKHQNKWDKTLIYFNKSIEIAEKVNAFYPLSDSHFELGLIYEELGDNKEAKKHFDIAVDLYNKLGLEKSKFVKERISKYGYRENKDG